MMQHKGPQNLLKDGPAGSVTARVTLQGDRITQLSLESSRPVLASQVLIGKRADQALQLLPMLFSLCRQAQRAAGLKAYRQAVGLDFSNRQAAVMTFLVALERVVENARRLLMDWPLLLGIGPRMEALKGVLQAAQVAERSFSPLSAWHPTESAEIQVTTQPLLEAVTKMRTLLDPVELEDWLHGCLTRTGLASVGQAGLPLLEQQDDLAVYLAEQLTADHEGHFRAGPRWRDGGCLETGVGGGNIGDRLVKRLDGLKDQLADFCNLLADMAAGDNQAVGEPARLGQGFALVPSARGVLAHWVAVEDGRITDWRVLAPTEWNFHPEGLIKKALEGVHLPQGLAPEKAVQLYMMAVDPCVEAKVILEG